MTTAACQRGRRARRRRRLRRRGEYQSEPKSLLRSTMKPGSMMRMRAATAPAALVLMLALLVVNAPANASSVKSTAAVQGISRAAHPYQKATCTIDAWTADEYWCYSGYIEPHQTQHWLRIWVHQIARALTWQVVDVRNGVVVASEMAAFNPRELSTACTAFTNSVCTATAPAAGSRTTRSRRPARLRCSGTLRGGACAAKSRRRTTSSLVAAASTKLCSGLDSSGPLRSPDHGSASGSVANRRPQWTSGVRGDAVPARPSRSSLTLAMASSGGRGPRAR